MKKIIVWILTFLMIISTVQALTIFEDDFNRPDNTTVGNGWKEGGSNGNWAIFNNTLRVTKTSSGGNLYVDHQINKSSFSDGLMYVRWNGTGTWSVVTDGDFFNSLYNETGLSAEFTSDKLHWPICDAGNGYVIHYALPGAKCLSGLGTGTSPLSLDILHIYDLNNNQLKAINYSINGGAYVYDDNGGSFWNFPITVDDDVYITFLSLGGNTLDFRIDNVIVYDSGGVSTNNFTISAIDNWDNAALQNISVNITLSNGSVYNLYNGSGSTIITPISMNTSLFADINISNSDYFTYRIYNYNTSLNLQASLNQSLIKFNATDILGDTVNGNITIGTLTQPTNTIFTLKAGLYNVTFNNGSAFAVTQEFSINPLENTTKIIENTSSAIINISVYNIATASNINTFSANIYNITTGYNVVQNTTSGSILIPVNLGSSYTVNITGDFSTNITNILINVSQYNYTAYVYNAQTVLFSIRDEETRNLITTNMTIEVVGTTTKTTTTINGNASLDLFTPGSYAVRWYSTLIPDYQIRSQYITITENSIQDITLYSLNNTNPQANPINVVFTVFDQNLQRYEGSTVTVKRYYSALNTYVTMAQIVSDSGGQAQFTMEDINAFYQYTATDASGNIKFTSSNAGTQFVDDNGDGLVEIPIFINTQDTYFDNVQVINNVRIASSITFTNTSAYQGYFTFTSQSDVSYEYCLSIYSTQATQVTCQTSDNPSIIIAVNTGSITQTETFSAVATFRTASTSEYTYIDQLTKILNPIHDVDIDNATWKENATFFGFMFAVGMLAFADFPVFLLIILSGAITATGYIGLNINNITLAVGIVLMLMGIGIASLMKRKL